MKRLIVVMACAIGVTAMSSCERNYVCTCVYPDKAAGTAKTNIKAYHRSDAQETCSSMNKGAKLSGGACAL